MYLVALTEDEWSVAVQVLEHGSPFLARKVESAQMVDPKAWSSLLEGWGDGTNDWDRSDVEPVYKGAIHPISKALDPSYNDSPPYGNTWLEEEEDEQSPC
jgi:hypothetical protein